MYTAVVHAPDGHNDHRNYHLHIVAHDRPARWLDEHGCWDFQFEEHFKHKGEKRVRRPFKQKKISQVSQSSHVTKLQNSGRDFLPYLRREYARIANEILEERGITRRYDPRTYAKMRVCRTPTAHLGNAAAALEAIGVPTTVGTINAITIWRDAAQNITKEVREDDARSQTTQFVFEKACANLAEAMPNHTRLAEFQSLVAKRKRLSENLSEDREALMQFDNLEAKAKSRATRTVRTCQVYLSQIASHKADQSISSMSHAIETRFKDANAHLNDIEKALEPYRRMLSEAGRIVKLRRDRIETIDEILVDLEQQSALAVRLKAEMDRKADQQLAAEEARKAKQVERAEEARLKTIADPENKIPSAPTEHTQADVSGGAISKEVREAKRQDVGRVSGGAAPITIDGVPIVEPTIPPVTMPHSGVESAPQQAEVAKASDATKPQADACNGTAKEPSQVEKSNIRTTPKIGSAHGSTDKNKLNKPPAGRSKEAIEEKFLKDVRMEQKWNSVIDRVNQERIPISRHAATDGKTKYVVSELRAEEGDLLATKKLVSRTQRRLQLIYDLQRAEVSRLCKWIEKHQSHTDLLILDEDEPRLGDAKTAIETLWQNWRNDPEVVAAICAAREAREMEPVPAVQQTDQQIEIADRVDVDGEIGKANRSSDLSSTDCSPDVEYPALEEEESSDGAEFAREVGSGSHEDDEAESDNPPSEEANENTSDDDDDWMRTLASANRNGKKGRW
jgi:hypothetical protein